MCVQKLRCNLQGDTYPNLSDNVCIYFIVLVLWGLAEVQNKFVLLIILLKKLFNVLFLSYIIIQTFKKEFQLHPYKPEMYMKVINMTIVCTLLIITGYCIAKSKCPNKINNCYTFLYHKLIIYC